MSLVANNPLSVDPTDVQAQAAPWVPGPTRHLRRVRGLPNGAASSITLGGRGLRLTGSIAARPSTCGRAPRRTETYPDQQHGPIKWSPTGTGHTVHERLTVWRFERDQRWIDNGRRLRELAHQLETPTREVMRTTEGWDR